MMFLKVPQPFLNLCLFLKFYFKMYTFLRWVNVNGPERYKMKRRPLGISHEPFLHQSYQQILLILLPECVSDLSISPHLPSPRCSLPLSISGLEHCNHLLTGYFTTTFALLLPILHTTARVTEDVTVWETGACHFTTSYSLTVSLYA